VILYSPWRRKRGEGKGEKKGYRQTETVYSLGKHNTILAEFVFYAKKSHQLSFLLY